MPSFYGKNYAKTLTVPPTMIDNGDYSGPHRFDSIDTTIAMTTADKIYLGKLLPGERLLGGQLRNAAHGSGRTIKVGTEQAGTAVDDDALCAATSITAAGVTQLNTNNAGFCYLNETAQPMDIVGILAGGTLAAATDGFKLALFIGGIARS